MNRRDFNRMLAASLATASLATTTGCFGSFALTKAIYNFNAGFSNAIVQWLVFVIMASILPVYAIGVFIDVWILNVLEFWLGSNPMAANGEVEERTVALEDGGTMTMRRVSVDRVEVTTRAGGKTVRTILVADENGARVLDETGTAQASLAGSDTEAVVWDSKGNIVRRYSETEVREGRKLAERQDFMAMLEVARADGTAVAAK